MSNRSLIKLLQAGLWPSMKKFVATVQFWYMRVQNLTSLRLSWKWRDWRMVYMNLRSTIQQETEEVSLGRENAWNRELIRSRFSHLDTIEVALELGWYPIQEGSTIELTRNVSLGGNVAVLQLLERTLNVKFEIGLLLRLVVREGHLQMTAALLERYDVDSEGLGEKDIDIMAQTAASNRRIDVLHLLLQRKEVNPLEWRIWRLEGWIRVGHTEVIRTLLEDGRIRNPVRYRNFEIAITWKREDILFLLLDHARVEGRDSVRYLNFSIRCASIRDDRSLLASLLRRSELTSNLSAVEEAILLSHRKSAFILACSRGHLATAQLLLENGSIDPGANKNQALRLAVQRSRYTIVEWLLTLDSVHPLKGKKCALSIAYGAHSFTSREILRLLLRDRRVWNYDIDLSRVNPNTLRYNHSRIRAVVEICTRLGLRVDASEVLSWITKPYNTYLSLLQFLIMKGPSSEELLSWLKACTDTEVKLAVRSAILQRTRVESNSATFFGYRALLLTLLDLRAHSRTESVSGVLQKMKLEGDAFRHASVLLAAYLSEEEY